MDDLKGQLAFITGGASGAGLGQAKVFGRAGAKIVIADIRQEAIDKALGELRAEGIEAHGIVLDITDRAAYAAAADEVERVFGGPPTILSNTAGVNSFGPIENTSYDDFDWIIGVNLGGVINGCATFVPRMIASGRPGHVVSVSSMGGLQGASMAAPYSAAKAAVINLMESYRQGLEKYGIGVSVVCPATSGRISPRRASCAPRNSAGAAMSRTRSRSHRCTRSTSSASIPSSSRTRS